MTHTLSELSISSTTMAPVRVRGPNGISTIQVDLNSETYTVQDLQQEIRKATDILPSRQIRTPPFRPRLATFTRAVF